QIRPTLPILAIRDLHQRQLLPPEHRNFFLWTAAFWSWTFRWLLKPGRGGGGEAAARGLGVSIRTGDEVGQDGAAAARARTKCRRLQWGGGVFVRTVISGGAATSRTADSRESDQLLSRIAGAEAMTTLRRAIRHGCPQVVEFRLVVARQLPHPRNQAMHQHQHQPAAGQHQQQRALKLRQFSTVSEDGFGRLNIAASGPGGSPDENVQQGHGMMISSRTTVAGAAQHIFSLSSLHQRRQQRLQPESALPSSAIEAPASVDNLQTIANAKNCNISSRGN
uniref:PDZ domain-containing protein n=1 Tax=Macrostomum lignano TaxID=282301 RepID=A0A1I8FNX9_9PLAT